MCDSSGFIEYVDICYWLIGSIHPPTHPPTIQAESQGLKPLFPTHTFQLFREDYKLFPDQSRDRVSPLCPG